MQIHRGVWRKIQAQPIIARSGPEGDGRKKKIASQTVNKLDITSPAFGWGVNHINV